MDVLPKWWSLQFMMKPFQGRRITFSNVVSQHFHFSVPSSRISISTVTPKRTFWKFLFKNIKINHWSQKSRKQKHNLTEVFIRWLGSHQPFFWGHIKLKHFLWPNNSILFFCLWHFTSTYNVFKTFGKQ